MVVYGKLCVFKGILVWVWSRDEEKQNEWAHSKPYKVHWPRCSWIIKQTLICQNNNSIHFKRTSMFDVCACTAHTHFGSSLPFSSVLKAECCNFWHKQTAWTFWIHTLYIFLSFPAYIFIYIVDDCIRKYRYVRLSNE